MDKKRILIVIYILFILTCLIITIFFGGKKTKKDPAPTDKLESQENASPTVNKNQPSINVGDTNNAALIKKSFNDFKARSQEDLHWTIFVDENNNIVQIDKFFNSMDAKINPKLNNLLDYNNYKLFSCGLKNKRKEMGVVLTIKLLPDFQGNLEEEEKNIMKEWEESLFQDTRTIIFPNDIFSQEQLEQKLTFQDGIFRYANIPLPDNQQDSLNYAVTYEYIVISNSPDCINKVIEGLTI